ncbi:hypothetical protein [Nocardia thraciensis]
MFTLDVTVPAGLFTPEGRRRLARGLTAAEFLDETCGATDPAVLAFSESRTDVIVREADVWIADGRAVRAHRYLVTVCVGAWAAEMSALLIERITRAIGAADPGPERPEVLVQIYEVPEGGYGLDGVVRTATDFLAMVRDAKVHK